MSFYNLFQSVAAYFRLPSAESLALRELEEAKRKLLDAQTGREYAESMCRYHEARIKRLTAYVHSATETK
jgi:hypothetical protein